MTHDSDFGTLAITQDEPFIGIISFGLFVVLTKGTTFKRKNVLQSYVCNRQVLKLQMPHAALAQRVKPGR